jgi:hypothetical protein
MHYDFIIAGNIVKAVVDTHERLLLSVVFIAVFIARNKGDIAGASVLATFEEVQLSRHARDSYLLPI